MGFVIETQSAHHCAFVFIFKQFEAWKCIFPEYRIHHLGQPFMLVGSKYDSFQLGQYLWGIPQDQGGIGFAMSLAGKMTSIADSLVHSKNALIFLSACATHTRSIEGGISGYNVYGTSIEAAVKQPDYQGFDFMLDSGIDEMGGLVSGIFQDLDAIGRQTEL